MIRLFAVFMVGFLALSPAPVLAQDKDEVFIAHEVLKSVVGLKIEVPIGARTARTLGFEREGTGVVISSDGLILTVGYLILEADSIEVLLGTEDDPVAIPARAIAYDHDSGFGLVRAGRPLDIKPVQFGESDQIQKNTPALVVSFAGHKKITPVRIADRRPFAGFWEFMTDNALFTMPAHLHYGGAALFDPNGYLVGIGSLFVNDAITRDTPAPGNMFLGIDSLKPILGQLVSAGKREAAANPWLGLNPAERAGRVVVSRVRPGSPAYQAGLQSGDIIMGVNGRRVGTMTEYFQRVWDQGRAGVTVTLDVLKKETADLGIEQVDVESVDRSQWLLPDD